MKWAIWVCGGRGYDSWSTVYRYLKDFPAGTILMHGDAPGADTLADEVGEELGFILVKVPYHKRGGRAGGPIRNKVLAELLSGLKEDRWTMALAFGGDRGTDNAIENARRLGIKVKEIDR